MKKLILTMATLAFMAGCVKKPVRQIDCVEYKLEVCGKTDKGESCIREVIIAPGESREIFFLMHPSRIVATLAPEKVIELLSKRESFTEELKAHGYTGVEVLLNEQGDILSGDLTMNHYDQYGIKQASRSGIEVGFGKTDVESRAWASTNIPLEIKDSGVSEPHGIEIMLYK